MNIEQLQRFLVVADCLNFTTAAERLYVGQSTISRQIAALEQDLGAVLLIRGPRSVELTEAGVLLKDEGTKLMSYISNIRQRVANAGNGSMGTLRIATLPAVFPILDELYAKTAEVYPDLKLSLSHSRHTDVCQDLDIGSAEVGVTYSFLLPASSAYEIIPLYDEHFCVLCSKKHWIAKRKGIYLDEMRDEDIYFGRNSLQLVHSAQANPYSPQEHPDSSMEGTLMRLPVSDGVMVLPSSSAQLSISQSTGLACVPLLDEDLRHQALLLYRKDCASPALKRFLEIVHSSLGGGSEGAAR